MTLEQPILRFAITGTLIMFYSATDHLSRLAGRDPLRARVRQPRWVAPVIILFVLVFYSTIRPLGGPILHGWGNLAGILLAFAAMTLRWLHRSGAPNVRQPDVAARMLFYVALPFAAGVPSGLLTLTFPAAITSAWCCVREDRILSAELGDRWQQRMASTKRWVPGLW